MTTSMLVFSLLVFTSVFLLALAATSEWLTRRERSRDFERAVESDNQRRATEMSRFMRRPYIAQVSRIEKFLERRPELERLRKLTDQAGLDMPIYRLLAASTALALIAFAAMMLSPFARWLAALVALGAAAMPILALYWLRARRVSKIDMQLADAVDMVKRSLRAGNPLVSTFRLVANNMNDPIAHEFGITAADLSYGNDPRSALLAMLDRVPSVSLRGFVTAILVQRETGGNLAETLDHISDVIRKRFRFERKLRTLSAEGRLSAWVLIAVPFALAAVLQFTSPNYLNRLLDDPRGPTLLAGGAVLMCIGVIWIRRISRVAI